MRTTSWVGALLVGFFFILAVAEQPSAAGPGSGSAVKGRKSVKGHSSADMPVWGDAFSRSVGDEDEVRQKINDLVEFLRTIQQVSG